MEAMTNATAPRLTVRPVGELLRQWRTRRRLSQLELAGRIEISTRHLSSFYPADAATAIALGAPSRC